MTESHVNVTISPEEAKPSSAANKTPPTPAVPPVVPVVIQPKSGNVFFDDGKRRIDFVLVFEKDDIESEPKEVSIVDPPTSATVTTTTTTTTASSTTTGSSSNVLKRLEALPHLGGDAARSSAEKEKLRLFFESNLIAEGLELEEDVRKEEDGRMTIFVKVHAGWPVLCKQAELLKMKMPLKLRDTFVQYTETGPMLISRFREPLIQHYGRLREKFTELAKSSPLGSRVLVRPGTATLKDGESKLTTTGPSQEPKRVTWLFRRKKLDRFDVLDQTAFFTTTQRMEMVWEIMQKVRNDPDDEKRRGIELLLHTGVYEAAFPLHDAGDVDAADRTAAPIHEWPSRSLLKHTWANWRAMFKPQPLDLIRSYYGEKIAFYFAFLGFYTKMLVFPAIFGVCAFFFGLFYPIDDEMIQEICNKTDPPGSLYLCPSCKPPACEFLPYSTHCTKARLATWMDNEATVVVAFVTVIWATIFVKKWKQREAELSFEWDVYEVEQEDIVIRPEYEHRAPMTRPNPVTRQIEPYIPPMLRFRWKAASTTITLLMLLAVACALAALVIARVALYGALKSIGVHENVEVARWLVHGLIFITVVIFDAVYNWVAEKVTSLECPRTRSEWLSSFLWKVFTFELLNDFVPIAYAAWVKGRTVSTPLDLGRASELCDASGCMSEVTELIAVLLLARMFVGNAAEIGVPFLKHYLNRLICDTASTTGAVSRTHYNQSMGGARSARRPTIKPRPPQPRGPSTAAVSVTKVQQLHVQQVAATVGIGNDNVEIEEKRWRSDVLLGELELDGVANEYMEMIVQFAFCTLFVPAFPVAAAVCLLNNILEIRVDAIKILASHRRPLPIRASGIGIWNEFMGVIVKVAVLCNAGLIAFTSDAVVRIFYNFSMTSGFSYKGYPQFSLSSVVIPDEWREELHEEGGGGGGVHGGHSQHHVDRCYYDGYRNSTAPYNITMDWWRVTCIRLGSFGVFVAIGFTFQFVYDALVPDVPEHVETKIQRQRYVLSKAMESEVTYESWLKNHNGQQGGIGNHDGKNNGLSPNTMAKRSMGMYRPGGGGGGGGGRSREGSMMQRQGTRLAWK